MKINVVDSIMGSGKTSWAISKMKADKENKYVYITPFLTEVKRVKESCHDRKFVEPTNIGKGKQDNFHQHLVDNRNVVSTHSLFRLSTDVTQKLIESGEYILILDEVMDVIEQVHLKKDDIPSMIELGLIRIEDGFVLWNEDKIDYDGKYNDIKIMANNKTLMMVNNVILMWNFPVQIFRSFKEVWILTYMFYAQIQKYYYDLYKVEYQYYSIQFSNGEYKLADRSKYSDVVKDIKSKVHILDDNINKIGDDEYALSVSWFRKEVNKPLVDKLQKNLVNCFKQKFKSKSKYNLWTTFSDFKGKLSGQGYTKGFIAVNARATNDYADRKYLAYCANIFLNPIVKQFFIDKGVTVLEDKYALSELLQWIWRSGIRNKEEIWIYLPSSRMREIFNKW